MSKFDESKPHSITYGMGGVQGYEQNGLQYTARKKLIEGQLPAQPAADAPAMADPAPAVDAAPAAPATDTEPAKEVPDYAAMHWTALRKLVEENGGTWVDKAAAIEFLTAK